MAQFHSWLHSTFKEISNDTSHTQFRVKMKKLWPQQVEEEKNRQLSKNYVATFPDYVVTKPENLSRQNFYVMTKLEDNFYVVTKFICLEKVFML